MNQPNTKPEAKVAGWSVNRWTFVWRILVAFGISVASLYLLLYWTGNLAIFSQLPQVQFSWFLLAASVSAVTWILDALANWFLLRGIGTRLPFTWTLSANLAANFVSYLTPFLAGGPPLFIYLLSRKGVSPGSAAMVVTARLTLSAIIFTVLFPIFLAIFRQGISWSETWQRILNVPFFLLGALVVLILLFILWRRSPGSYQRLLAAWPMRVLLRREGFARFWNWLLGELKKMGSAARILFTLGWANLIWAALSIVVYWVAFYSVAPILLDSLGIPHPFLETFLGQAVLNALVSLSPTPGGSGASELGFATLFMAWVPTQFLGLFTALWRFLIYYLTLLAGGACFLFLASREHLFRRTRPAPPSKT
jgi:uncharacterized protein (TIRG00374 family)